MKIHPHQKKVNDLTVYTYHNCPKKDTCLVLLFDIEVQSCKNALGVWRRDGSVECRLIKGEEDEESDQKAEEGSC